MTDDLRKDGSSKMTNPSDEELIERLEAYAKDWRDRAADASICIEAAERLRTLAAERDEAINGWNEADERRVEEMERANALQSRLLKAVEGLKEIARLRTDLSGDFSMGSRQSDIARRTLQSIEAESGGEGSSRGAVGRAEDARPERPSQAGGATAWKCRTSGAVFASRDGRIVAGSCPVHEATCPLEPL